MKKTLVLIVFLWVYSCVFPQGIRFEENLALSEALLKAEKENKYIFIDFYTPWCSPCKMMTREVFPQKNVGDYFNQHFISLSLNGDDIAYKSIVNEFVITSYPSFIFLNSKGELIHRGMDGMNMDEFIELGETAIDFSNNLKAITEKIKSGDRTPKLLAAYFSFIPYTDEKEALTIEYFNALPDDEKLSETAWIFFKDYVTDYRSAPFAFFAKNINLYIQQFGKEKVTNKVVNFFRNSYKEDKRYFNSLKKNNPTFFRNVEFILKKQNS